MDLYQSEKAHSRYKEWRSKQIEKDLQYVPDKLTEEKEYLRKQAEVSFKTGNKDYLPGDLRLYCYDWRGS